MNSVHVISIILTLVFLVYYFRESKVEFLYIKDLLPQHEFRKIQEKCVVTKAGKGGQDHHRCARQDRESV